MAQGQQVSHLYPGPHTQIHLGRGRGLAQRSSFRAGPQACGQGCLPWGGWTQGLGGMPPTSCSLILQRFLKFVRCLNSWRIWTDICTLSFDPAQSLFKVVRVDILVVCAYPQSWGGELQSFSSVPHPLCLTVFPGWVQSKDPDTFLAHRSCLGPGASWDMECV